MSKKEEITNDMLQAIEKHDELDFYDVTSALYTVTCIVFLMYECSLENMEDYNNLLVGGYKKSLEKVRK